jgi:hypothetical protein
MTIRIWLHLAVGLASFLMRKILSIATTRYQQFATLIAKKGNVFMSHMSVRQRRAMVVYYTRTIKEIGDGQYVIQGRKLRNSNERQPSYVIQEHPDTGALNCPCKGFAELQDCQHMQAILKWLAEGPPKQGYENLDETKRPTYPQDRPRYSASRRIMVTALPVVLRALIRSAFPLEHRS